MITKKQPYIDPFKGTPEVADLHFHLNKNDILQLEAEASSVGLDKSLEDRLNRIMNSGNSELIYNEFKRIVLVAYGKRQGSRFVKSPDISADFSHSEEFSEFIFHLLSNPEEAEEFFTNLATTVVERAPMLSDIRNEAQVREDLRIPTEENVFNKPAPDPGPVVNAVSGEESGAMFDPDADTEMNPHIYAQERKKTPPRKLQQVEMDKMSFSDVMKGVEDGRWTLPG